MVLKVVFSLVVIGLYLLFWARWFREMYGAKQELDIQSEYTLEIMQQAFGEARELQAKLNTAMEEAK